MTAISRRQFVTTGAMLGAGSLFAGGTLTLPANAQSLEKITYLFPAPPVLPAFGPIRLAQGKGYFKDAGFEVEFQVGRGGVDVAKQVGAGNAPLGGIVADGPIMVRGNGVPVKIVCVFGGKGFMQLVVREDSGIEKPADLKGKTITVMSYQDTTFYALLGLMASAGLKQDEVNVQQVGPTGVWQFVAEGKSQGMAGVPDWIPPVMAAGVKVKIIPTETFFPHMAQAIAASDDIIKQKPDMVRRFVKAALRGMKDIMDDPVKAAGEFVSFVPDWKGKEKGVEYAFNMYAKDVYPGQSTLGAMDVDRLTKLQDFYLSKGFIQKATPVNELYTNEFVT
ncbi:MAG: ABC transporter substrate-binding protein [Alphaproteobacteria bacterium]|nr:ABC transporter substrate-binding protein [Alphaproteobacteria bacterium]